jgi:hypothetical protein
MEAKTGIFRRLAACFTDHRVEHTVPEPMAQRIFALALGYEDLNDHDTLRHDPLLTVLVDKANPTGQDRRRCEDREVVGEQEHVEPFGTDARRGRREEPNQGTAVVPVR